MTLLLCWSLAPDARGEAESAALGALWPEMFERVEARDDIDDTVSEGILTIGRLARWAQAASGYEWFQAFKLEADAEDMDAMIAAALEQALFADEFIPVRIDLDADMGQKTLLSFPFSGEMTIVQGHNDVYSHIAGTSNEFAWDFMRTDEQGKLFKGNSMKNESYFSWEEPVLAPADGIVTMVRNDMPDHGPAALNPTMANCVWIDHGNGELSRIYHLRQGSIIVNEGDQVSRGDVIGVIGDSGNSLYPHIHYQLDRLERDTRKTFPAMFCGYRTGREPGKADMLVICGLPERGDYVRSALPAANAGGEDEIEENQ